MKKIFMCLSVLALTSCYYLKGDYTLGRRNTFNDFFYTYNIRFFDNADTDTVAETQTISDFQIGEVKRVSAGENILSSNVMRNTVYDSEYVRPNMKGALVSYTVPVEFSDEKLYKVIGESEIDEATYRLLEPNRYGDIVLIDDRGNINRRVGRIYNGRLALLETQFILEPANLKFNTNVEDELDESDIISGFSVRYVGIRRGYLQFVYTSIQQHNGIPLEEERTFRFPQTNKRVSIEGVELEVLSADSGSVEVRILKI